MIVSLDHALSDLKTRSVVLYWWVRIKVFAWCMRVCQVWWLQDIYSLQISSTHEPHGLIVPVRWFLSLLYDQSPQDRRLHHLLTRMRYIPSSTRSPETQIADAPNHDNCHIIIVVVVVTRDSQVGLYGEGDELALERKGYTSHTSECHDPNLHFDLVIVVALIWRPSNQLPCIFFSKSSSSWELGRVWVCVRG
jgi:hypothetical protein